MLITTDPRKLDGMPELLTIYGSSDYATMEPRKGKKEPDFTEHGIFGLGTDSYLYALDWWYGQYETDKSIEAFIRLAQKWKPQMWWNEGGLIDKAIGPAIRRAMCESNTFVTIESLPSIQDKGAKLQSFHARYQAGQIVFPINRKWATRVIEQLVKFPAGRWDDAADVCGLIGRGLDMMTNPHVALPVQKDVLVPFSEKWLEFNQFPGKKEIRYF
jgi:predicted phage terminase large subunit-like protein